jgi:hypothetical protein
MGLVQCDIGDQPAVARGVFAHQHDGLIHVAMPAERCLDFSQLDAEPRSFTCASARPR